jgi:hypothetical protein
VAILNDSTQRFKIQLVQILRAVRVNGRADLEIHTWTPVNKFSRKYGKFVARHLYGNCMFTNNKGISKVQFFDNIRNLIKIVINL